MSPVDLWLWPIGRPAPGDWAVLDAAERNRQSASCTTTPNRLHPCPCGRRAILGRLTGQPPASLCFAEGPHGKPALVPAGVPPFFSLSHSGAFAALAVSAEHELGLDIEIRRRVEVMAMAREFFSREECRSLATLPRRHRLTGFFNAWTRRRPSSRRSASASPSRSPIFGLPPPGAAPCLRHVAWDPEEAACWLMAASNRCRTS
jgi:4'-phosphopantetheinyl transferase